VVVIIVVIVMVTAAGIRTGFRIERRLDQIDMAAETLDHLPDHMIRSNTDAISQQLHRQMAIT
jgi:hypothetical protein